MNNLYGRLNKIIQSIDFSKLYKGFAASKYALYDKQTVYLDKKTIAYDERFIGSTAIDYDGEKIAIWDLEYTLEDEQVFASKIVHEMFHVYQMNHHETRFPNVFSGINYNYDKRNLSWKYSETMYLVEAYKEKSMNAFQKFLSSRRDRTLEYLNETEYESKIETVEGMARYVELQALFLMNKNTFATEIEKLIRNISIPSHYLPIRATCYDIGALLLMTAGQLDLQINHHIEREERTIFQMVSDLIVENSDYEIQEIETNFIDEYYQKMKTSIQKIQRSTYQIFPCDAVTGLDPMNTFKVNHYYIFKHFVRIKYKENETNIIGESLGVLNKSGFVKKIYKVV